MKLIILIAVIGFKYPSIIYATITGTAASVDAFTISAIIFSSSTITSLLYISELDHDIDLDPNHDPAPALEPEPDLDLDIDIDIDIGPDLDLDLDLDLFL